MKKDKIFYWQIENLVFQETYRFIFILARNYYEDVNDQVNKNYMRVKHGGLGRQ